VTITGALGEKQFWTVLDGAETELVYFAQAATRPAEKPRKIRYISRIPRCTFVA
jgi:hypothetical protein